MSKIILINNMQKNIKPIKIAQVIGMAINGGTESLWMNYYRNIDRTKVQFDFLVESESAIINKNEIERLGGRIILIPSYKNPLKYIKTLTKIFKDNKYDIVHSNMNALSFFTLKAAKKAGIKVRIAHSHSTSNKKEWKKNIIKNILRPFSKMYATHYFACSELAGRWLFGNKLYDNGNVTIIKNAIDIDKFKFDEQYRKNIRKEFNVLEDELLIGNVGRMMPQKNQAFLLDVFAKYHSNNPKSKLMIINDGPLFSELKSKAISLNIKESVIFVGPKSDLFKYYSAFDIFALPSIYEGLGIVLVEAQANGLNCIASSNVPSEADGTGNVKFLQLNEFDWVEALKTCNITRHPFDFCKNKLIDNKYSIKDVTIELEKIYEEIVKE